MPWQRSHAGEKELQPGLLVMPRATLGSAARMTAMGVEPAGRASSCLARLRPQGALPDCDSAPAQEPGAVVPLHGDGPHRAVPHCTSANASNPRAAIAPGACAQLDDLVNF
mmetsp:Transcript_61234/g.178966  ORF Transcript_61234/g.178966 Transcript_61234/m.178966 type:complete len:111 (-) Transcript_61234:1126-1458(-)